MRLGVLGGTFNPVHLGHLILADEAMHQLNLDRVLWVLTPDPPHKPGVPILTAECRLRLLEVALAENPAWEISLVEINRQPPYYALETMLLLRTQFAEAELFYLLGGDSLNSLPSWHRPLDFVAVCDGMGVMHRPGIYPDLSRLDQNIPGLHDKVIVIEAPLLDISSSDIRERILSGKPYRYYLPSKVYQHIQQYKLYLS